MAAAVMPLLSAVTVSTGIDLRAALVMVSLVLLAEFGELQLFDRSSFSVGLAPIVAAALALGAPGAALVAPCSMVLRGVRRRTHPYRVVYNAATQVLAGAAAGFAASLIGTPLTAANLPLLLVSAGVAGVVYYLVNTSLTTLAMASDLRLSPIKTWIENFGWLWPQYLSLSVMGLLLAVAYHDYGLIGVAAFALPPLMMRYVAKQYVDRTQAAVQQLRALNRDLSDEIARRERFERDLQHQALHDVLTGLPNRILLGDRIQQAMAASRRAGRPLAVLVFGLDRFKEVNDSLGHQHGDRVLEDVGRRLAASVRESDTVARLSGDQFAVLLPSTDMVGSREVTRGLLEVLARPMIMAGRRFEVNASVGIAVYPDHGTDAATLLRGAEVAMYAAKGTVERVAEYRSSLDNHSPDRLALSSDLRRAIERDELTLYYQPKTDLRTGRVIGVEALVRWDRPGQGLVAPAEFIPTAEDTGLIAPLGIWVLEAALRQCRRWQIQGYDLTVAINLSARNLEDRALPDVIANRLERAHLRPESLVVELTEGTLMADPERALDVLRRIEALGVRIAMDDYGTGFSALTYLHRLPLSELKIDQSFVRQMASVANDATIVRSTIALAHDLGLVVVAEGVEDAQTLALLGEMGCDVAQGYHVARPAAAADLTRWLAARADGERFEKAAG